jgi:histidyl-tRNA synthetase
LGVERVLALMAESGARAREQPPDAYLVHSGIEATRLAWRAAEQMREAGLSLVFHCGGGSFKSQMKKADGSMARFAVIIGDDEAASQRVAVKPLRELGDQVTLPVADAIGLIRNARSTADIEP